VGVGLEGASSIGCDYRKTVAFFRIEALGQIHDSYSSIVGQYVL